MKTVQAANILYNSTNQIVSMLKVMQGLGSSRFEWQVDAVTDG